MTYSTNDGNYVVPVPADGAPIAESVLAGAPRGVVLERPHSSWISSHWWLPLLAALALASLLLWIANRGRTCHVEAANISITAEEENAIISHVQQVLPNEFDADANRAEALTAARQICASHLGGESGDVLNTSVTREFVHFLPNLHDLDIHGTWGGASEFGNFITGQNWCRCSRISGRRQPGERSRCEW